MLEIIYVSDFGSVNDNVSLCLDVWLCLYKPGNPLSFFLPSAHFNELYFATKFKNILLNH